MKYWPTPMQPNLPSATQARIAALRGQAVLLPAGGDRLPRARLRAGQFADVGLLRLLGIDRARYLRELRRGLLDVFWLGGGVYALELPVGREGPAEDFLEEAP